MQLGLPALHRHRDGRRKGAPRGEESARDDCGGGELQKGAEGQGGEILREKLSAVGAQGAQMGTSAAVYSSCGGKGAECAKSPRTEL